jgi:hypothetical protein
MKQNDVTKKQDQPSPSTVPKGKPSVNYKDTLKKKVLKRKKMAIRKT